MRGTLLIPFILMLIYLGAFAEKNAFPDMVLVLFFGFSGGSWRSSNGRGRH